MTDLCRTYYVSQKHGNDQNSGRSSAEPYASLFAINRLKLQPGDRILLENNSVFAGQFLQITDSGTKDLPIVIGAYEDRTQAEQHLPVIAANGQGIWYQDYGCELDSPAHTRNGYVSTIVSFSKGNSFTSVPFTGTGKLKIIFLIQLPSGCFSGNNSIRSINARMNSFRSTSEAAS